MKNFGECWSGPSAERNYDRDGRAIADRCIMDIEGATECDKASDQECVGMRHANYIYKLVESKLNVEFDTVGLCIYFPLAKHDFV